MSATQPSAATRPITAEDVARYPAPGMTAPGAFAFSADDSVLTCLYSPERTLSRQLFAVDAGTGALRQHLAPPGEGATEANVSLEEALRRERARQLTTGVTSYAWAETGARLLLPLPAGLYVQDAPGADVRLVVSSEAGPLLDPRFSPDGEWIAYVQNGDVWIVPAAGGELRQVTSGEPGVTRGLAEFVAQEEMDRHEGYWWSSDGRWLAFEEFDDRHIPIYRITHQGKDAVGETAQEDHRYPFAGGENARVRLGVVAREGGEMRWLDLGEFEYLARVSWFPDGSLVVQLQDRNQQRLDLVRIDPATGSRTTLLTETSDAWINLHNMLSPLHDGRFIWASERTGFRHLYLHAADGALIRALTAGDFVVDSLAGVDESRGLVYFVAGLPGPLEANLYAVSLEGGELRRVTTEPGAHAVTLDHKRERFVDVHDSPTRPPTVTLRSLTRGSAIAAVYENDDPRAVELALAAPEIAAFRNRHGDTLYAAVYAPDPERFGPGPYPTIVSVYGGPHVQLVAAAWRVTASMRAQYLRSQGFLVATFDNRGSNRRGLAFESALKWRMGSVEVEDQVDGVRWLVTRGLADKGRVGIYGWSYGGYMTLMALVKAPETFKVGVAGAPVTHYDGYDTHYTERYMGRPQDNPEGYRDGSVMAHVANLEGKLLIIHGLIDENVHFRHTARLINALIRHRKPYDLMLFPDERHSPRRVEDRVYMEERIAEYFAANL